MTLYKRLLLAVLAASIAAIVTGCSSPTDSSIPWSRPAGWEGQVPGMGSTPGAGNR